MHQLTSREAELLAAETPTNLGHTSLLVEFDHHRVKLADRFTFERLRQRMNERIHLVPAFRRRVYRVPLNVDRPWWLEDPNFDLEYHLRHSGVPSGATEVEDEHNFTSLIARLHERPLDRSRPLWEMYFIDRVSRSPVLFIKMHHVLIDGVTGLDVLAPLVDGLDDALADDTSYRKDRLPDDSDLVIQAGWSMARSPWRVAGLAAKGVGSIPVLRRVNLLGLLAPWVTPEGAVDLPQGDAAAPRVSFNRTISAHRRVAFASLPVSKIREIRQKHDVPFNDVILALVAGTLRHWLVVNDELPSVPLVALTPMLVDSVDEPLATLLVPLATHRHEPVQRLEEIAKCTAELTDNLDAQSVDAIRSMYDASPAMAALASRLMVRTGA